jgi:hypothetical protein
MCWSSQMEMGHNNFPMAFDKSGNNVLGVKHLHVCPNWFFCVRWRNILFYFASVRVSVLEGSALCHMAQSFALPHRSLKSCKWAAHNTTHIRCMHPMIGICSMPRARVQRRRRRQRRFMTRVQWCHRRVLADRVHAHTLFMLRGCDHNRTHIYMNKAGAHAARIMATE